MLLNTLQAKPSDLDPVQEAACPEQVETARSLLAPTRGRDVQDATFCEELSRLFNLTECQPQNRPQVESFIREAFTLAYSANIRSFMPRLFTLCSKQGNLLTAFGVRSAQQQSLFLENYLDRPIEQAIEDKAGVKAERSKIIEIGNLAAIYPGMVRWMIVALTVMLYEEGCDWVVFTGTPALRNSIYKLGLHTEEICPARIEHLSAEERVHWGTYYERKPTVIFGNIPQGFHTMRANGQLLALLNKENVRIARVLQGGMKLAESAP